MNSTNGFLNEKQTPNEDYGVVYLSLAYNLK